MVQNQLIFQALYQQQQTPSARALITAGGLLGTKTGTEFGVSDFSPYWLLVAHPESFPWGVGWCPKGMKLDSWVQLLLSRYPRE